MRKAHFNLLYTEGAEQVRYTRLEFCGINLARETIRREILLYGFWNFKFKARGLGYHRKDLRAARRLKI